MEIDAEVNFELEDEYFCVCFKHAVKRAMKGENIKPKIKSYTQECPECNGEIE